MVDFLKNNKTLILFNILWIGIYFTFFCQLSLPVSGKILFSTPDAAEYLKTGYEFFDLSKTGYSETRPFLYPFFVRLIYGTFGAYALWFVQFLFWLISVNLIYKSVLTVSKNRVFSSCIAALFCLNITLIVLTLHGLTEVISVFLLSIFIYLVCTNMQNLWALKFLFKALLISVLLAVIKPLFFPVSLVVLGVIIILHFKALIKSPGQTGRLVLILLPLALQLGMMKFKYDKLTISTISDLTWRKYLTAQVISDVNHFIPEEMEKAEEIAESMSPGELNSYFKAHFRVYFSHWRSNVHDNLGHESNLLQYPAGHKHPGMYDFMQNTNIKYRKMHSIFFVLFILCSVIWIRKKNYGPLLGTTVLLLVCYYIFGTSGISFSQGDRLVITSLPVFFVAYAFLLSTTVEFLKGWYLKMRNTRV